ncbi:hypothetical protein [Kribbella sp. CA-294648]|uniref:hypothetical protein n=1 Tax=Kribbella sp. CA-294648 TaxID=3239948 RepID=UPI003D89C8B5
MRRKPILAVAAAVAVAIVLGAGLAWNRRDADGVHNGRAFATDGGVPVSELTTATKGDEVWVLAPAPANISDSDLTINAVQPGDTPPGLDYIEAKIFNRDDFPSGVPLAWDTGSGDGANPALRPSVTPQGYKLQAGQTMDKEVILLHFRVTTEQRPLETTGVTIEYSQKGKHYQQTLEGVLKLQPAPAVAK